MNPRKQQETPKVVRHGRRLLLRLPRAYPHALAFLAALQRLRLLPTFA